MNCTWPGVLMNVLGAWLRYFAISQADYVLVLAITYNAPPNSGHVNPGSTATFGTFIWDRIRPQ
eukprot:6194332-Pleurochrysis_carterae.AAC.3